MPIIGLAGKKGAGKTTVARAIAVQYDGEASVVSFATIMKRMIHTLLLAGGVTDATACVYGDQKERPLPILGGKTARWAMQTLGTEWGREMISPTLWVDISMTAALALDGLVIFDDVRLPNEADAIHNAGGMVFNIIRPGLQEDGDTHSSEAGVAAPRIDNTGSPAGVARAALEATQALLKI